jgi:hypothetical protein
VARLDTHWWKSSRGCGLIEGAGRGKTRRCIAKVGASLWVHRRHRNGELAVTVCEIVTVVLLPNRGLSCVGVLLLVLHACTSGVVAWYEFWGRQKLPWQVLARIEGRHDGAELSQKEARLAMRLQDVSGNPPRTASGHAVTWLAGGDVERNVQSLRSGRWRLVSVRSVLSLPVL